MKIIVIGGVAGGATCASQIRRMLPDAEITVFEKDRDMSFANCGLPYFLGNEVKEREYLVQASPERFESDKNIKVKTYHEVTSVNIKDKAVEVKDILNNKTETFTYDKLILSPGAHPVVLPQYKGHEHIFHLRNLEDTDHIEHYITENNVKNVLVAGAGYISLEMAENFIHRGLDVTLVHRSSHLLKAVDASLTGHLPDLLKDNGVRLMLNEEVISIQDKQVNFKSGASESFDMILTAVGIQPSTQFLKDSGIELTDDGYIITNEYFQTSDKDIYALGDAIETFYRHTGDKARIALAWGTHRAASIISENINKNQVKFKGLLGTNIIRLFDHTYASTGITEQMLNQYEYDSVHIDQKASAGYMPESYPIEIIVHYDRKTRKLLRASTVGKKGVDKRIDIIAAMMGQSASIDDFKDIEIAYSPPYSSPKDAVNMIGYKAKSF